MKDLKPEEVVLISFCLAFAWVELWRCGSVVFGRLVGWGGIVWAGGFVGFLSIQMS